MPKSQASASDPLQLVGCVVEGAASDTVEMARCFVEEFFYMGWSGQQILEMFRNPFYRGPHAVSERFGEPWVQTLITEVAQTMQQRHKQPGGACPRSRSRQTSGA